MNPLTTRAPRPSRRLRPFLLFGLAALALAACTKPAADSADVIVLQTGRLRGNAYPLALQNIAPLQHYPYLAGYVKKIRAEAARTGAKVVVIDLGDSLGGSFASHATGYANMVALLNETGYDFVVLGNLDNNIPASVVSQLKAKVLCPFMDADGQPATAGTQFAARTDFSGQPVEVLANFYGDTPREQFPERFPTWFGSTPGNVEPVRDYAPITKALGPRLPGTLTLLSWMKFESPKDPPTAFLAQLDQLGVNAILAHRIYSGRERDAWSEKTFHDWKPPVSENILRDNGGFTIARLDLKRTAGGWRVLSQQLLPMTANTAPADPAVVARIADFTDQIRAADKPLGDLPVAMTEDQILLGYLTALSEVPGTQIAAYSHQSIREQWPAGPLTASRVYNSLPWTTPLVQLTLTPEQVERLGKISGMVLLRRQDLAAGQSAVVTTSRFFGSLLAQELGLPPQTLRPVSTDPTATSGSEFDYFVAFLARTSKPLDFTIPADWAVENPGAQ
jgi:2',3'-cyclic-nucleotide 2'-phosphodiesterase (5'-nucleotidase family)